MLKWIIQGHILRLQNITHHLLLSSPQTNCQCQVQNSSRTTSVPNNPMGDREHFGFSLPPILLIGKAGGINFFTTAALQSLEGKVEGDWQKFGGDF